MSNPIKVLFPATDEEQQEATRLYKEGKAASGEDQQQGLEDEDARPELEPPTVESSPFQAAADIEANTPITAGIPPQVKPSPFRKPEAE